MGSFVIHTQEKSAASYVYKGKVKIIEDTFYGILRSQNHPDMSFAILKIPFNRREKKIQ